MYHLNNQLIIQDKKERKEKVLLELKRRKSHPLPSLSKIWRKNYKKYCAIIDEYDKRFHDLCILSLINRECSPDEANRYDKRFHCLDVLTLVEYGCLPDQANRYPSEIPPWKLAMAVYIGIKPENILLSEKEVWLPLIEELYDIHETVRVFGMMEGPFSFLSMGKQGLLLTARRRKIAIKIGKDLTEEARLYKKVEQSNPVLKNVIHCYGLTVSEHIMGLEFIEGKTLLQYLQENTPNPKEIISYGKDILNGIAELRRGSVSHGDLWLGNIMIDSVKNRAVIIDLGSATDNFENKPKCNRRYGGENDLQSLGQIIYKMITRCHIFNPTIDTSTHIIPERIKKERERIYADQSALETRLKQIDENVPDKNTAEIIRICLTSEGADEDYQILEAKFKESIG